MDDRERDEIVETLLARLRAEGAPEGTWLVEIEQAREHLAVIDSLLRRLSAALVAAAHAR